MAAVGRRDLVLVGERCADTRCDSFLTHVEVEEAGQFGSFSQSASCLFEETDSHHSAVHVHQHVVREVHVCPCVQLLRCVSDTQRNGQWEKW
jgi:hypothetical protein